MTLAEYQLRMEAYSLQQIKIQERLHLQAFLNQTVQATKGKKNPKPVYQKFEQFFNAQKMVDQVRSAYEPDYIPASKEKLNAEQVFTKRLEEFKRLKKAGKIIPLKDRKEVPDGG